MTTESGPIHYSKPDSRRNSQTDAGTWEASELLTVSRSNPYKANRFDLIACSCWLQDQTLGLGL